MPTYGLTNSGPVRRGPLRAVVTIWVVVNLVNALQAAAFVTRAGRPEVQRAVGMVIAVLAIPATASLVAFVKGSAGWRFLVGPLVFDAFVVLLLVVEYALGVEFRSPARLEILIPFLTLFFGSIFLMGAPMYRLNRRLWAVTALTTIVHLGAMSYAMQSGVA